VIQASWGQSSAPAVMRRMPPQAKAPFQKSWEGVGEVGKGGGRIMINCRDESSHSKPAGCRRSWRRVSIFVAAKRGLSRRAPPDSQPTQAPSPSAHLVLVPAISFVRIFWVVGLVMAKSDPKKEPELHPDAWARFERAVDVVAKSPPQHRTKATKRPRKRGKTKRSKTDEC
jgi:hypothetical protein